MRVLLLIAGIAVVLGVSSSVVRTLVVPRALRSKLTSAVLTLTNGLFRAVVRRASLEVRDRVLAWAGPMSIVLTLSSWLVAYLGGFALMLYGASALAPGAALREAGSSLLTLGFASSDRSQLTAVDFLAAATGPIIIGLLIGYLPTLYAAYNRRETEVTMLESRAGEPNWGPEILARHAAVSTVEQLRDFFRGWERWAADVSESHTNYPVLVHFRSPQPHRSWLVGLAAVMDAAALQLALAPQLPQGEARIALRMGFQCLRALARNEGIDFEPDPHPDDPVDLSYQEFMVAVDRVRAAGFPITREPLEAWPHFRGWRVNYESVLHALTERLDAVPALWTRRSGTVETMGPIRPPDRRPSAA